MEPAARLLPLPALAALALACAPPSPPGSASASASASVPVPASVPAPASGPRRACAVAVVGDSLTSRKAPGDQYIDFLERRFPGSRFVDFGRGGDMVNQMRRRFFADVVGPGKPPYTHVVVFGGVNDLYSDQTAGRTPALVEKDLTSMYEAARASGARVVAITLAPWGSFRAYNPSRGAATREVNAWIREQKQSGAIDAVIEADRLLACGNPERLCPSFTERPFVDGLHFGPRGHEKLAEEIARTALADCL